MPWGTIDLIRQDVRKGARVAATPIVLTRTATLLGLAVLSTSMLAARDAPAYGSSAVYAVPADGSVLEHAPERVVVTFGSSITSRSTKIALTGPHGNSSLSIQGTGSETRELSIPVPDQGAGKYLVKWEIVSTDGDHRGGMVRFSVRPK
jgi:methionine-rich copper-binding protein CopC